MRGKMIGLLLAATVMGGCTRSAELLKNSSMNVRSAVFQEVSSAMKTPAGYAELTIYSSLKTGKPGIYWFDSSKRGTPEYALMINIDGQVARIGGVLHEDKSRQCNDPEAGEGIRYSFRKVIQLRAGSHRLMVASPADGIAMEKEIVLAYDTKNYIQLEPQYGREASGRKHAVFGGSSSFHNGIIGFKVRLNGVLL